MVATKRAIDMSNVKEQGNVRPRRLPEGDYRAVIKDANDHKSKNGNEGWEFIIQPVDYPRASYAYYTAFDEKQAWKIRGLLVACGLSVPAKRVNIDPNKLIGKELGITLEDDEYEGREKSTIAGVFPTSDLPEDKPKATKSTTTTRKRQAEPEPDDTEDDTTEDDDVEDLDLEDL